MNIDSYERQIFKRGENNYFVLPWSSILVRNINSRGVLVEFKSLQHCKKKSYRKWILCHLYLFRDINNNNAVFPLFVCSECRFMNFVRNLPLDQNKDDLQRSKCIHSRLCDNIESRQGFVNMWPINLNNFTPNDVSYKVSVNINVEFQTLVEEKYILAAVYNREKDRISILHNFAKVKTPLCQTCTTRPCNCLR